MQTSEQPTTRVFAGTSANSIRVMLVDEHELVRCGIARLIANEAGMQVVAQAASGEDAVELLEHAAPDVIAVNADRRYITKRISRQLALNSFVNPEELPSIHSLSVSCRWL
jgi:DNA-binding NarL/FixJ family response regulator